MVGPVHAPEETVPNAPVQHGRPELHAEEHDRYQEKPEGYPRAHGISPSAPRMGGP
jgi:hypothetical protein